MTAAALPPLLLTAPDTPFRTLALDDDDEEEEDEAEDDDDDDDCDDEVRW
jgi:hypothetical protein